MYKLWSRNSKKEVYGFSANTQQPHQVPIKSNFVFLNLGGEEHFRVMNKAGANHVHCVTETNTRQKRHEKALLQKTNLDINNLSMITVCLD